MTDFHQQVLTAAADGSRDAAALVRALADDDDEARDVILANADAMQMSVSLAALVATAIPNRVELDTWLTAWRDAAASTEDGTAE